MSELNVDFLNISYKNICMQHTLQLWTSGFCGVVKDSKCTTYFWSHDDDYNDDDGGGGGGGCGGDSNRNS